MLSATNGKKKQKQNKSPVLLNASDQIRHELLLAVCRFAVLTGLASQHESMPSKLKSNRILKVINTQLYNPSLNATSVESVSTKVSRF